MIKLTITSEVLKEEIENEIKELEKASDTDDDGKMQIGIGHGIQGVPRRDSRQRLELIG
jgi:hypothetical protein